MIPIYTRWRIREAFWILTRTPVSDRIEPLVVVDIQDDPFGAGEIVHDLPERVVQCHTCPAELPELNQVHFVDYPLTMCFQCSMVLLHLGGAGPETRVHVSLDLLRRLRDVELMDDLKAMRCRHLGGGDGGPQPRRPAPRPPVPVLVLRVVDAGHPDG